MTANLNTLHIPRFPALTEISVCHPWGVRKDFLLYKSLFPWHIPAPEVSIIHTNCSLRATLRIFCQLNNKLGWIIGVFSWAVKSGQLAEGVCLWAEKGEYISGCFGWEWAPEDVGQGAGRVQTGHPKEENLKASGSFSKPYPCQDPKLLSPPGSYFLPKLYAMMSQISLH